VSFLSNNALVIVSSIANVRSDHITQHCPAPHISMDESSLVLSPAASRFRLFVEQGEVPARFKEKGLICEGISLTSRRSIVS
jgi:hypothetical protein